jgi:hypothetical protein
MAAEPVPMDTFIAALARETAAAGPEILPAPTMPADIGAPIPAGADGVNGVTACLGAEAIGPGADAIGPGADAIGAGADAIGAGADAIGAGADPPMPMAAIIKSPLCFNYYKSCELTIRR